MKEKLVVVIAKGDKYIKQCNLVRDNIEGYAKKCDADFAILQELPSYIVQNQNRDIFSWKILLPYIYREYDLVLFVDMDIFISPACPNLFEMMPDNIGLMAKVQCRGTDNYKKVFRKNKRVLRETNKDYFENNGFVYNEKCVGDINGGVLLFRPKLVADMYKEYYYSDHCASVLYTGDEPALAYLAQTKELFADLDAKYNTELMYVAPDYPTFFRIASSWLYNHLNGFFYKKTGQNKMPIKCFIKPIIQTLIQEKKSYIIHFAGGYWREDIYKWCCSQFGSINNCG